MCTISSTIHVSVCHEGEGDREERRQVRKKVGQIKKGKIMAGEPKGHANLKSIVYGIAYRERGREEGVEKEST